MGARVEITQPGLELLVRIELDVTDDFGQPGHRTLVLEAMGRRSNLILLDGENRVIDCMRRVDAEMSAARQVLPGLFYEPPASTDGCPFRGNRGRACRKAGPSQSGDPAGSLLALFSNRP